ncbi:MAG: hypothetical protein K9N07_04640 [Candidatus Cloacimonetes bacterium]|nr:hypothetical protein [Candidatus Cloacimonadota bacterium]
MKCVLFDDAKWSNFFPITLTRSIGDLRVGILKLRQRISAYLDMIISNVIVSSQLEAIYKERHKDWQVNELEAVDTIFVNSRLKIDEKVKKQILALQKGECLIKDNVILAARLQPKKGKYQAESVEKIFSDLTKIEPSEIGYWKYLWDLIQANSHYINRDFNYFFYEKDNYFETELGTTVINPYNVWIGEGTVIKPGVVIDAADGPVVLDENVTILSNSVIIGPVYIGKGSTIKSGAKIYAGTSIGPVCKIGGEIEETIFQGYSNKQHDGFLGHSYLGEWINIGAGTNNSDLKNNYQTVAAYFYPENKKIDTKGNFLGTIIGDHSKTGINATINTGTVIGVGCSLFGSELIRDHKPSFSFGTGSKTVKYTVTEFLETAALVKKRRGLDLSGSEKELYSQID